MIDSDTGPGGARLDEPLEMKLAAHGQVCTTVVDDLLEAQLATAGQVCTTVVDALLEAQLAGSDR